MAPRVPGCLVLAIVLATLPRAAAHGSIIVDLTGGGDYTTIQAGIDAASEGDTVLVMPGTYTGAGNRNLSFGTKNILLRGQAGAAATVIDCESVGGTRGLNFYAGGQDTTCIVDGFTVRRGRLTQPGYPGAGVRCDSASPKLVNLVIEDNNNVAGYGGGLHCNSASPVVRNVLFDGNRAQSGGGLFCNTNAAPRLRDVTFFENDAVTHGGGAYCGMNSDAWFSDVVFEGNSSSARGGALACFRSSPALAGVVVLENTAADSGGALYVQRWSSPVVINCTLSGNSAPVGGAVCVSEPACAPIFTNSIIAFTGPGTSTVRCGLGTPAFVHCIIFGNAPGDSLCGDYHNNAFVDPLFCNVLTGDLTVAANSPCIPPTNPWGQVVGALGQGCANSTVERTTWGSIKWRYR